MVADALPSGGQGGRPGSALRRVDSWSAGAMQRSGARGATAVCRPLRHSGSGLVLVGAQGAKAAVILGPGTAAAAFRTSDTVGRDVCLSIEAPLCRAPRRVVVSFRSMRDGRDRVLPEIRGSGHCFARRALPAWARRPEPCGDVRGFRSGGCRLPTSREEVQAGHLENIGVLEMLACRRVKLL